MKPVLVNKDRLEAQLCKESFYDFFLRFWKTIVPEELVPNWHLRYLCDELQHVAERVFRREPKEHDLIVNVSPGSTKSTICSVMFPIWCWVNDPTFRMICGSYAFPLSLHLARQSQRVLQSDKFQRLYPELVLAGERTDLLETTQGGQRIATSTGGSITGMHGHVILIDDPINPKEAVSDVSLKTANEWFDHTLMTRMIDRKVTPVVLIMQRLHQNDPTGHLLERQETTPLRHICIPATDDYPVHPRSLRRYYREGLFDPVRLPRVVLDKAQVELGQYAYAGQYGQAPVPMGGGMFRIDQIRIAQHPSRLTNRVVRYWDKAGTGGKGCWTVGVKMSVDTDKRFWILDVVRGQWEASERERVIKNTAILDGKGVLIGVEQEPGSGGKESAQLTLRNLAGYRVRLDKPVGDKALRADPFASQLNQGNVVCLAGGWVPAYLAELQYFPHSKYKDQVDASSGAFAMLTKVKMMVGGL